MNARIENRDRVIREAMIQIFALQLRLGASIEEVKASAHNSIRIASECAIDRLRDGTNPDVQQFGSLLRTWHRDTRFLSKDGFPKHLGSVGRNSLRTLVYAHYPMQQYESVIRSLRQSGLIRRDSSGRWFPTTKHALFPSLSVELLDHFSEGVARFIETMSRNVVTPDKEEALFERSSKVKRLPVSAAQAFRQFVNGQALAFLEAVDDWLEGRVEMGKKSKEKKCTAGVFAFAFMDDLPPNSSQPGRRRTGLLA